MSDSQNKTLSHIDASGKPTMVDVSDKSISKRSATAQAIVRFPAAVYSQLQAASGVTAKGSIIDTAIVSGVMAAKKTHELIPFCHPLALDNCTLDIQFGDNYALVITCEAKVTHKTGVEMEALTGASVAALTIYDMCKALSHDIVIEEVRLLKKTGGKSDYSHKKLNE
jgi:cyclic pyranopterin phosphate synthase